MYDLDILFYQKIAQPSYTLVPLHICLYMPRMVNVLVFVCNLGVDTLTLWLKWRYCVCVCVCRRQFEKLVPGEKGVVNGANAFQVIAYVGLV